MIIIITVTLYKSQWNKTRIIALLIKATTNQIYVGSAQG